ncbi:MAG TPA: Fe-S cluster assembly protein SufD [Actinomycetota bacterium]|nr:Fe-S cluster assembly protein SufD [Actinomycetota bacterium]
MTTTSINATHVDALASGAPEWAGSLRRAAWERHLEMPAPTPYEEVWRFTDMSLLDLSTFGRVQAQSAPPATTGETSAFDLAGGSAAGTATHIDSLHAGTELSEDARAAGIVYMPLDKALVEHEDIVRPRLGSLVGASDHFTSWQLATHSGGMFLYVPRDVVVEQPISSLHRLTAGGVAVATRTLVVVEPGAKVVFNDVYTGQALDSPSLHAPVVELFIGQGASVGWLTWQDLGPGTRHLAHVKAHLERDARLESLVVTLGGDYSRTWKECAMAGEGSSSVMLGLFFPHGSQRFEHWTVQDHVRPHTTSDLLYKGALADDSNCVYYGTIRVRPGAARTDAYQANRNLALSPKARVVTQPQLEIENNDVRCTHGATIGQVDPDHLFYIQSRGVEREQAEQLVVFGFFNEVLERVQWSGMHERLADAIATKMKLQRGVS